MAKYIIIGAGPAGIMAAERIRAMESDAEITMISVDEHVHSRCMLHKYLGHERDVKGINFVPEDFFEKNQIRWVKGEKVTPIECANDPMVRAKFQVKAALMHIIETEQLQPEKGMIVWEGAK